MQGRARTTRRAVNIRPLPLRRSSVGRVATANPPRESSVTDTTVVIGCTTAPAFSARYR
ncbi:hypothetical protein SALBM217S_00230 [Streptomyces griseoloalbus]